MGQKLPNLSIVRNPRQLHAPRYSLSPPPPPYPIAPSSCGGGESFEILEPQDFTINSSGWEGSLNVISDPWAAPPPEIYIAAKTITSTVWVEFPASSLESIAANALNLSGKYIGATYALLNVAVQYQAFDHSYTTLLAYTITLTGTYTGYARSGVLNALPSDARKILVSITLEVITPQVGASVTEVRVNHLVFGVCGTPVLVSPPPGLPPSPLETPPQTLSPPTALPPFLSFSPPGPPLTLLPPPFVPPLPPGSEILRPNQDIFVSLWNPRPVFMQINENLNLQTPDPETSVIYAPALVEIYDDITGCFIEKKTPRLEVGLTDPQTSGPWDYLQVRFRAARSRPPEPEIIPEPPSNLPDTLAPRVCPPPLVVRPQKTHVSGSWITPPLELSVRDPVSTPDNTTYISSPVKDPPSSFAVLETEKPFVWSEGWNRITVRLIARARPAKKALPGRNITGMSARTVTWTERTDPLPGGTQAYSVKWNPFTQSNDFNAVQVSPTQVDCIGVISTDININGEFFISSRDSDNIVVSVSLDGVNYTGGVVFSLSALDSLVVYYRIQINESHHLTPTGKLPLGLSLRITGPIVLTPIELISWPLQTSPLILAVNSLNTQTVDLQTTSRVKVSLTGNSLFDDSASEYTNTLTDQWVRCVLTWHGFWDQNVIKDLHFKLQAVPLVLQDDIPSIDISAFEVELNPYCPGLSEIPLKTLVISREISLKPNEDLSVLGWTPVPAYPNLLTNVNEISSDCVMVDPRVSNQILLGMEDLPALPPIAAGYSRSWINISLDLQANLISSGFTTARLLVSTNFGSEQTTELLTPDFLIYSLSWDYGPGLTADQIDRLRVSLVAEPVDVGSDDSLVYLWSMQARVIYQDTLISGPPPPLPPSPPGSIIIDPMGEVFSCGSLGGCTAPVGSLVGTVVLHNMSISSSVIMFIPTGDLNIRVFDYNTPTIEYSLTTSLPAGHQIEVSIMAWVGSTEDPYPVDPRDGAVLITMNDGSTIDSAQLDWFYIGL